MLLRSIAFAGQLEEPVPKLGRKSVATRGELLESVLDSVHQPVRLGSEEDSTRSDDLEATTFGNCPAPSFIEQ